MWRVKGVSMDNYTPLGRPQANWVIWSPNNDGIQKEPGHDLGYLVVVQVIPSILSLKRGMKGVGGRERVEKKDEKKNKNVSWAHTVSSCWRWELFSFLLLSTHF